MDSQSTLCPYGLASLVECVSRAALLTEPKDIPEFLNNYLSELITFRDSNNETDPKVSCFLYEEQLGKLISLFSFTHSNTKVKIKYNLLKLQFKMLNDVLSLFN